MASELYLIIHTLTQQWKTVIRFCKDNTLELPAIIPLDQEQDFEKKGIKTSVKVMLRNFNSCTTSYIPRVITVI